jgi:hypothetical protein
MNEFQRWIMAVFSDPYVNTAEHIRISKVNGCLAIYPCRYGFIGTSRCFPLEWI